MKSIFYGILGAIGIIGIWLSLLAAWITVAPTSNVFYERNMSIAKAFDETRVKGIEMDRDLKLSQLDATKLLEIEHDALRSSITSHAQNEIGSRTRAQDETRIKNMKDRRQKQTFAGLGLLVSLLVTAYAIWRFRAEQSADHAQ